ncbi:MAG: DUF2400 domain-containing protein [Bacteroidales bacterium]|nr:DUF2400 domain-containing protein [Bacteroidales bacterium]
MDEILADKLRSWAERYNNPRYFAEDPIAFPRRFAQMMTTTQPTLGFEGGEWRPSLQDVEIAAVFAAHFAWGRRAMIVRDCSRLFDEMLWRPYDYVMAGDYRNDNTSIHRTVKWSEVAAICKRLRDFYAGNGSEGAPPKTCATLGIIRGGTLQGGVERSETVLGGATLGTRSLEELSAAEMRTRIFGQKADPKAANKKIWMMHRWMVRRDGKVDLGLWKNSSPADLIIPLDVHVYRQASELGLVTRKSKDFDTAREITAAFEEIFPGDPAKGDFALFGYGVNNA